MSETILVIADDAAQLRTLGGQLEQQGFEVARELDPAAGLAACDRLDPDVVVLDLDLATAGGDDLLAAFRRRRVPVLAILDQPDDAAAAQALRRGAEQVLVRPGDPAVIAGAVARVAEATRARRAAEWLAARAGSGVSLEELGTSPPMRAVVQQIGALAQSDRATLLIQGEPGVGKGEIARLIHRLGPRADEPFLALSCQGVPAVALESQLFGHERGGLAEARQRSRGLLELAGAGTALLRQVGALPVELQPVLLRALETRTLRRVGGQRDLPARARLIVTSSRDLAALVEEGLFREDLHYRLSTMVLTIPPVRERSDHDRLALIAAVHLRLAVEASDPPPAIDPAAMERLLAHAWPGNVREMVNVLDRAALLARGAGAIQMEHLPGELRARPGLGDRRHQPMSLDELERLHIDRTLRFHGGNRTRAAKELRISRATLINKIKRYGLTE